MSCFVMRSPLPHRSPPPLPYRIRTSVSVCWLGVACLRLPPPVPTRGPTPPDMSWDVMFCHARGPHGAAGPACCGRPGPALREFHPVSGIGLSSRSVFAPFSRRPAARRGGPTMPRAIARAGGRVGAGAVRAPDCARARAQAQGAPLLPAPSVVFRAGPGAGGSGLRKPLPVFCSVFILAYFAELQALRRYFFIISCHEIEYSGKNTRSRDRRRPPPRIGSGAAGRVWAASAKSGKPDFSSRSFARAGERGAKVRPARPAGTPDKRRREMCACGSPFAGGLSSRFPLAAAPLHSIPPRSVRAASGRPATPPIFACTACGRGRALAPARLARLIAPVRARRTQGAPLPPVPARVFPHRCNAKQPPDAAAINAIIAQFSYTQACSRTFFEYSANPEA